MKQLIKMIVAVTMVIACVPMQAMLSRNVSMLSTLGNVIYTTAKKFSTATKCKGCGKCTCGKKNKGLDATPKLIEDTTAVAENVHKWADLFGVMPLARHWSPTPLDLGAYMQILENAKKGGDCDTKLSWEVPNDAYAFLRSNKFNTNVFELRDGGNGKTLLKEIGSLANCLDKELIKCSTDGGIIVAVTGENCADVYAKMPDEKRNERLIKIGVIRHDGRINAVEVSGNVIVTTSDEGVLKAFITTRGNDGNMRVHNIAAVKHRGAIQLLDATADGCTLVVMNDGSAKVIKVLREQCDESRPAHILTVPGTQWLHMIKSSCEGTPRRFLTAETDGMVKIFDIKKSENGDDKLKLTWLKHIGWARIAEMSSNGKFIVTAPLNSSEVRVDAHDGDCFTRVGIIKHEGNGFVKQVALSPNGTHIAITASDGTVSFYAISRMRRLKKLGVLTNLGDVYSINFSQDGQLASIGDKMLVLLGEKLQVFGLNDHERRFASLVKYYLGKSWYEFD